MRKAGALLSRRAMKCSIRSSRRTAAKGAVPASDALSPMQAEFKYIAIWSCIGQKPSRDSLQESIGWRSLFYL